MKWRASNNISKTNPNDMQIISLTEKNFQSIVETAARAIQRGDVVVAPTDTVYGLLANSTDKNAVKKIYAIKNRPDAKPLPILIKNMAMAKKLAKISAKQLDFLETKWPGKLTAVLYKNPGAKIFGTDDATVALRIPFNRFITSLLETLNLPVTGTSANTSGQPCETKIDNVLRQLLTAATMPDLVINAGDLAESKPSTIIDMTHPDFNVIRP
jgi:L-threonylcarbamoyladenylate synthase